VLAAVVGGGWWAVGRRVWCSLAVVLVWRRVGGLVGVVHTHQPNHTPHTNTTTNKHHTRRPTAHHPPPTTTANPPTHHHNPHPRYQSFGLPPAPNGNASYVDVLVF